MEIKIYGDVEKPKGEAVFYMENDIDTTIWAVFPCGTADFLAESNSGEWIWYRGNRHYAESMSAERISQ